MALFGDLVGSSFFFFFIFSPSASLYLSVFLIWNLAAKNNKELQNGNASMCILTHKCARISKGWNTQMSRDTHQSFCF